MNITECFTLFELPESSTLEDIKKRFKQLVLKYHPDRNKSPDAQEKFIKITEAYKDLQAYKQQPVTPNFNLIQFDLNPYYGQSTTSTTFTIRWG